ncbi:MAG: phenylalanine--tRNA ligase subunit beta, partial [Deltaproteobacteria bacterium]|nr:phenylalanine--tRNA ligase subunit beta [Deltaproteobacteria bacterium]
ISNVVDVSNYVMLETGQPLHAFDLDLLKGSLIDVRRAAGDNKFVTLDEEERKIDPQTLMICDGQGPVAIAGIMGGLNSEINSTTKNVLLESAFFQPASIRRSARILNLGTEASYRFERGVDSQATARAANRAAELLQELAQGKVAVGVIDISPAPRTMPEISFRPQKANALLGLDLDLEVIKDILARLEIKIIKDAGETLTVVPPAWRFDIEREVDLIEEVARLYGYDQVPVTAPSLAAPEVMDAPEVAALVRVRETALASGYSEAVNYSFIDPQALTRLGFAPESRFFDFVRLKNPISSEMAVMRTSLLPGLLANLNDNLRVNVKDVRLFEVGRAFYAVDGEKQPSEELFISGVACGRRYSDHFSAPAAAVDFFDLKGLLEEIAGVLNLELGFVAENYFPCLTPGRAATIKIGDLEVGSVGQLRQQVAETFGIDQELFVFELFLTPLLKIAAQASITYQGLARFP